MKLISDAYLYNKLEYDKRIFDYLMTAERVNKSQDVFSDIIYSVKKLGNPILLKVLLSDKVVLVTDKKGGMSRAFKVMYVKDVKDSKKPKKVFIDCTELITNNSGIYSCKNTKILISYLITAMTYIIYYNNPKAIINNTVITKKGTDVFINLMLYILSYLKVPITYNDNKERISFVLAEYYMYCIQGVESDSVIYNIAKSASGIKDKNTCDYLHTLFSFTFDDGKADLNDFIIKFAEVFLDQKEGEPIPNNKVKFTVEAFVHRWMYAYGSGTFLGLECFVPYSAILTDVYTGGYINSQNTIEKVGNIKHIFAFTNELLKIGEENA